MWTSAFLSLLVVDESLLLMTKNDLQVSVALWTSACYDNHAAFGLHDFYYWWSNALPWSGFPIKPFLKYNNDNNFWLHYGKEISSFACIYLSWLFSLCPQSFDKWKQCRNNLTCVTFIWKAMVNFSASAVAARSYQGFNHLRYCIDKCERAENPFFLPLNLCFEEQCSVIFADY